MLIVCGHQKDRLGRVSTARKVVCPVVLACVSFPVLCSTCGWELTAVLCSCPGCVCTAGRHFNAVPTQHAEGAHGGWQTQPRRAGRGSKRLSVEAVALGVAPGGKRHRMCSLQQPVHVLRLTRSTRLSCASLLAPGASVLCDACVSLRARVLSMFV